MSNQHPQFLPVLHYWHQVEFFESTDIQVLHERTTGVLRYDLPTLTAQPDCLPWLNRNQVRRAGPHFSPAKAYRYHLYLGIFDRGEIFQAAKDALPQWMEDNDEQWQDEGLTCSIKLVVDKHGRLEIDRLACSTVTWALGQLQGSHFDAITLDDYEVATQQLRQRLRDIAAAADNVKQERGLPLVLTTYELLELLKAMAQWSAFSPKRLHAYPALLIQLAETEQKPDWSPQPVDPGRLSSFPSLSARLEQAGTAGHRADTTPEPSQHTPPEPEDDIAILNSFYLRDIERVITDVRRHGLAATSPLGRYLSDGVTKKPDLLSPRGQALLRDQLRLSRLPLGRWPAEDTHAMSLMQQFAINTLNQELFETGLYSINGPPGTGKTTLLRDLVAHNLVRRAEVLATLPEAAAAFTTDLTAQINGSTTVIKTLIPALTGFEMVVVSSNNAAVENISKELPQRKTLGQAHRQAGYLRPVAQKLAADHHFPTGKGAPQIKAVPQEETCWGLIAASLGRSQNRDTFGSRVFFQHIEKMGVKKGEEAALSYRTLFHALKDIASEGSPKERFRTAQAAFVSASQKVQNMLDELQRLEALQRREESCQRLQHGIQRRQQLLYRLEAYLALVHSRLPAWWQGQVKRRCRDKAMIRALELRLALRTKQLQAERHRLAGMQSKLEAERLACAVLRARYPDAHFAGPGTDVESASVQRQAFGQCLALNQARAQLTVAALALHQAWLAAAYKETNLTTSLLQLMNAVNGKVQDQAAAKALWQLLFMCVPLVSSTFASVARQFAALGPGDIGWLFVDEAGQACPQQAVGALWRARRAVVVGDPLQIEPVFTLPPAFVSAQGQRILGSEWTHWAPTMTSVQLLADKSNPYGTQQITKALWLGSPLRVHRRCDDPMFSIANRIAYNNKMIHGSDDPHDPTAFIWGPSQWFDVRGEVAEKHFVPAQAEHVLGMLTTYLRHHGDLPDVYIISPFKRVKTGLRQHLKAGLQHHRLGALDEWLNRRIGTVHTFQGKEEKSVILVLGLSTGQPGAAQWASAKPNLLNVAVTRAQKRVYIVGCKETWAGCPYFSVAHETLITSSKMDEPCRELVLAI